MQTACVVGATSWGLTLAWLLAGNGHPVTILTRSEAEAARLDERRTLERLPGLSLPPSVSFSAPPAIPPCDGLIIATPAQHVRTTVEALADTVTPILSAAKGIESPGARRMTEVLHARWPEATVSVLSGPNLSAEILAGHPAAAVVASNDDATARVWQEALNSERFRCYRSSDVVGVEVAGALKNVVAIATGIAWGLDAGTNAVAALMTRGLAELTRLGVALGANASTFGGLAGVGDLAATCFSPLSRNRRFGELLARGMSAHDARSAIGEAVEGIATTEAAVRLGQELQVDLPICNEVLAVLRGGRTPHQAVAALMGRPPVAE